MKENKKSDIINDLKRIRKNACIEGLDYTLRSCVSPEDMKSQTVSDLVTDYLRILNSLDELSNLYLGTDIETDDWDDEEDEDDGYDDEEE